MEKFVIHGGKPLVGEVEISGAKNAAVAILPATILAGGKCVIENLPNISDVSASVDILSAMGAHVRVINKHTLEIDTAHITATSVPNELSRQMRASYYFLGALLGRFGKATVAMPGGCNLGPRPIDQHLKAFVALGAKDSVEYGMISVESDSLRGEDVFFDTVSVGATINAMLAAVMAEGQTVLENVAKEPHIVDVANFLNRMGADVRGAAPGTRETDLCAPENTVERANAVVLAGGSAFGLAAATGVMAFLEKHQLGMDMGVCHVPIVPGAVIFDLTVGDAHVRPDAAMGIEACKAASKVVEQGAHGAGTGATVGKLVPGATPMQSGVGTASIVLPCGVTVGAIAVVNACGDVYDIRNGRPLGFGRMKDGTPVLCESLLSGAAPAPGTPRITTGQNTTIAVVATDAVITKAQARRLATCAHDGLARAIRPVHTQMDGDTIFALGTGRVDADVNQIQLCAAAAEVMARAVVNAVAMGRDA